MARLLRQPVAITKSQARRLWLHAQRLDADAPFGSGPMATPAAVRHLGYVAVIALKTDRERRRVLLQRWTWIGKCPRRARKVPIEDALHRFEQFQLSG
jgi:hypothetical protein